MVVWNSVSGWGLDLTRWISSVTRRLIATRESDFASAYAALHEGRIERTKRLLSSHRPSQRTAVEPAQRELSSRVPGGVQRISLSHHDHGYGTTTRPKEIPSSIFGRCLTTSRETG